MKKIPFLIILMFICEYAIAQKSNQNDYITVIDRNKMDNTIESASFGSSSPYRRGMGSDILAAYLKRNDANHELKMVRSTTSKEQITVEKYQQYYKGVKVEHGQYAIMYNKSGRATFMSGNYYDLSEAVSLAPAMAEGDALKKALEAVPAEIYTWQSEPFERLIKQERKDRTATYYPHGELVLVEDDALPGSNHKLHLAYKFDVYAVKPLGREVVYVDAFDGHILSRNSLLNSVGGSGVSSYSGNVSFEAEPVSGGFRLLDLTRGSGVMTVDWHNLSSGGGETDVANASSTFPTSIAIDAHWGAEKVYDYWLTQQGRNGFDDAGGMMKSAVHVDVNLNNAYWDGTMMHYGDGDGSTFRPLASLDVCAHEIGHAINQYTANLVYNKEPGAMNEGFSDIWAAVIEHWANPYEIDMVPKNRWKLGEEVRMAGPMREMDDPNAKFQPDTYKGYFWYTESGCTPTLANDYCGVHTNSGVLNHWFYLLTSGGMGTNDIAHAYTVTGVGIVKAAKIAYETEQLLTSVSKFINCRTASIQAAAALYGDCSPEVEAVIDAWYAVGVGTLSAIDGNKGMCVGTSITLVCGVPGGTWSSDNPSVATISAAGVVNAIAIGTATISYTLSGCGSPGGYSEVVSVNAATPTSPITGVSSPLSVCWLKNTGLVSSPAGGYWSSSNPLIADFTGGAGTIAGLAAGTVTVSYSMGEGCPYVVAPFTVKPGPSMISVSGGTVPLCTGWTRNFWSSPSTETWSSSTPAVLDFLSPYYAWGVGTALSVGTTTISYTLPNACYITGTIEVISNSVSIMTPPSTSMCTGNTLGLVGFPGGGDWTSSNLAVATVGPTGVVTAVTSGVVTITYRSYPGSPCYATIGLTIFPSPDITGGVSSMCAGTTMTLTTTTGGATWSSSSGAATVGMTTGIVTAVATGTAVISCNFGTYCSTTRTVTVVNPGVISGSTTVCEGASIGLSPGSSAYGGTWTCVPGTGTATIAPTYWSAITLTGLSVGTVSVSYTLGGCTVSSVISINPMPTPILGASDVCEGTTITLSNGVPGGSWSTSSTGALSVDAAGVVTGITSGAGLVYYTLPAGCQVYKYVAVHAMPHFDGLAPSTICVGTSFLLTPLPFGGSWVISPPSVATVTYWGMPGITVLGSSLGTATFTYSIPVWGVPGLTCSDHFTVTVIDHPLPITGNNAICAGSGGITLSSGTPGGTWSTGDPALATITTTASSTGVLVGTPPGTYASGTPVSVTYTTLPGCSTSTNVSVYWNDGDCSPCNPAQFGTASFNEIGTSGLISEAIISGNYYLKNDVSIVSDLVASDAVMFIEPGTKIKIRADKSFTSNGSHLFTCSTKMWKGIELEHDPGATARIILQGTTPGDMTSRSTLIEDAEIAVQLDDPSVPGPGGSNFIESHNTIFNRNNCGISITNYTAASPSLYEVQVDNTTFTCRNLGTAAMGYPMAWPGNYGSGGLKNSIVPATPYLSPFNVGSYPATWCRNGTPAYAGVRLIKVGTEVSGSYSGVQIGEEDHPTSTISPNHYRNMYDLLGYGIHATDANLTTYNGVYQNARGILGSAPYPMGFFYDRVGIYTFADNGRKYALNVLPTSTSGGPHFHSSTTNEFYDCQFGVISYNYNHIKCLQTEHRSPQIALSHGYNRYGILMESPSYEDVRINENKVYNMANGISFTSSYIPGSYVDVGGGMGYWGPDQQNLGNLEINGNQIHATTPSDAKTTQYLAHGIIAFNTMPWGGGPMSSVVGNLHTDFNEISDAYRGILVNGYNVQQAYTVSNKINILPDIRNLESYGISHANCTQDRVFSNVVSGRPDPNELGNDSVRAYLFKSNKEAHISCNRGISTNRGFEFQDRNPATIWRSNSMDSHFKGLVLNNAEIGTQGNYHVPSDNSWVTLGWWTGPPSHDHTFVIGTPDATHSALYIHGPLPTMNGEDVPGTAYAVSASLIYTPHFPRAEECNRSQEGPMEGRPGGDGGLKSVTGDQQYKLFPNPNDGNVTFRQAIADTGTIHLEVTDVLGRSVFGRDARFSDNSYEINVSTVAPGMYVATVTDGMGVKYIFRFVKQ